MDTAQSPSPQRPDSVSAGRMLSTLLLAAIFVIYGLLCYPIPSVGEPYYLGKARHFWEPNWCPDDLFLNSANTHFVFYGLVGWLTKLMPLPAVAISLRILAMLWLANGWLRLGTQLRLTPAITFLWAGLFLALQLLPSFAGEWLIGGAESKLFSYAFLLYAIPGFLGRQLIWPAINLGAAIAFHPVVGLWGAIAITFSACLSLPPSRLVSAFFPAGVISLLFALPGLIPGLLVLSAGDLSSQDAASADFIQVFHRLRHHLDPVSLQPVGWVVSAGQLIAIALLWGFAKPDVRPLLWGFLATCLIALVGVIIGLLIHPQNYESYAATLERYPLLMKLAMTYLKVYPFRVFDLATPFVLSLLVTECLAPFLVKAREPIVASLVMSSILLLAALLPMDSKNPSFLPQQRYQDWLAMCEWSRRQTSPEATFVMPYVDWAFHWHAARAQYVSYKNMPQDAKSLLEWNRRLRRSTAWRDSAFRDEQVTTEELETLARETQADYLITDQSVNFPQPPAFRQGAYQVIQLGSISESHGP